MNAYILLKSTSFGSFMACVVADNPTMALEKLQEGIDTTRYRSIGFDDILKDDWIITPPERLSEQDLIEVPEGKTVDMIFGPSCP